MSEIERHIKLNDNVKVLDIGTGAGFLSMTCAQEGCIVTGIDISSEMIKYAHTLAQDIKIPATFKVMDAEHLHFDDATFDLVIARNVTWLMLDPLRAYKEWLRVLKPKGHLINFDADYGKDDFINSALLSQQHIHRNIDKSMLEKCEQLKREILINHRERPLYDQQLLDEIGASKVEIDFTTHQRVSPFNSAFYNPAPVFSIHVIK